MPSDIRELVHDAAATPEHSLDVAAAVTRAKRLKSLRVTRMLLGAAVLATAGFVVAQGVLDRTPGETPEPPSGLPVPPESLRDRLPDELDDWVRPGLVLAYVSEDDVYHVFFEGVAGHSCPAGAKPEVCFSTAQHITWNHEQVQGVTGSHDLRLPALTDGIEVLWRGSPEEGSIGVRSPGACDRIERFERYECIDGVPVYMPKDDANDLSIVASAAREFGFGRLPGGDVSLCPRGSFASDGIGAVDVQQAVGLVVRAANSPEPDPEALWRLMDPAFQELYPSHDRFASAMRRISVPRFYRSWGVSDQVWGPSHQRLLDIRAFCGNEVARATWMGSAYFPRFNGVSGGAVQMFFLARPDGPRLWFTY